MTEMCKSVNLYCADSLVELDIDNTHPDFFLPMMKPFKNVRNLSIQGTFNSLTTLNFSFPELFPSLESLSIQTISINDPNSIIQLYRGLKCVHVRTRQFDGTNHFTENNFKELLTRNPQVRKLKLESSRRKLLEVVNELLPELEDLELHDYYPSQYPEPEPAIEFKNVNNLTMNRCHCSAPKNVHFNSLVEYNVVSTTIFCNRWIDVVGKSLHLDRLFVKVFVSDDEFIRLAGVSSNLTQMNFKVSSNVQDTTIVNLIRNSHKLNIMHLFIYGRQTFDPVVPVLQQQFGNEFLVSASDEGLLVTRRINQ